MSERPRSFARQLFAFTMVLLTLLGAPAWAAPGSGKPVLLGLDGEFGLDNSTSAQALELGMRAAIAEINAAVACSRGVRCSS